MAMYKYAPFVQQNASDLFDQVYKPGAAAFRSGIYYCEGCGREVACEQGSALPHGKHHPHTIQEGTIRWRLIVFADHRPSTNRI